MGDLGSIVSFKRLREQVEADDGADDEDPLAQLQRMNPSGLLSQQHHSLYPNLNITPDAADFDFVAEVRGALVDEMVGSRDHGREQEQQAGQGPDFNADRLQVTDYHDLVSRKRELIALLKEQGDVPHLQHDSINAINAMIVTKAASWQLLLRRALTLFSTFCDQQSIPTFPISSPKVALYLCRLAVGEDDPAFPEPPVASGSGPDLTVSRSLDESALDPSLQSSSSRQYPPLPIQNPKTANGGNIGPRPKKTLRRKTLEQYVNRLTTLRAPTIAMWRNRSGFEGQGEGGLGVMPVVKNIFERAGGEGSMDVKKRGRHARNAHLKGQIKVKKLFKGKGTDYSSGAEHDLEVGSGDGGDGGDMMDPLLDDGQPRFSVANEAGSHSFNLLIDPALAGVARYLPSPGSDLGVSSSQLPLGTGLGETYTLSAEDFVAAMQYIKSLQDRGIEERINGEISRSVGAATGVDHLFARGDTEELDELIDPDLE